jgi:hypothetical protein
MPALLAGQFELVRLTRAAEVHEEVRIGWARGGAGGIRLRVRANRPEGTGRAFPCRARRNTVHLRKMDAEFHRTRLNRP